MPRIRTTFTVARPCRVKKRSLRGALDQRRRGFFHPAMARAQTQAVHDAADVVRVVTHAKARVDGLGEAHGGPAVGVETGLARTRHVNLGRPVELFLVQPAGAPRGAPLPQCFDAASAQRPAPARGGGAAYAEFAGNLGLGKPGLQVLCGQQTPAFHFIASEKALCGCIHTTRGHVWRPERYQNIRKQFECKLFFAEKWPNGLIPHGQRELLHEIGRNTVRRAGNGLAMIPG